MGARVYALPEDIVEVKPKMVNSFFNYLIKTNKYATNLYAMYIKLYGFFGNASMIVVIACSVIPY